MLRNLGHRAGHLHPGGACAHHRKGQPRLALDRVGLALGLLESSQHATANGERITQGLQAWRVLGPVVAPEIAVRGASRQDQVIEVNVLATIQHHTVRCGVNRRDLTHQHGQVALRNLLAQDVADRARNRWRGQPRRGHLVQQGLEQMVVGAVNHHDFDVSLCQSLGGLQPTKTTADDHDTRLTLTRRDRLGGRWRLGL